MHAWVAQNRPDLASRIIFITGDIANENKGAAGASNVGALFVEKPFRVQQFIDVVSQTFGNAE